MISRQPKWKAVFFLSVSLLVLGACARSSSLDTYSDPEVLFWRANYDFTRGNYKECREKLRLFLTQFPDSPLVPEARLGVARTYFEEGNYEQERVEYERFLSLHPRHDRMDEALYFIALSYFRQIEKVDRDQTAARQAVVAYQKLLTEVPDTRYKEDARAKILFARRRLAAKEIDVGLFYLKRDKFKAAQGRFQRVLDRYSGTGLEPKALYYLGEAHEAMEEKQEAEEAYQQVLQKYPDSLWAVEAGDRLGIRVVLQSEPSEYRSNPEERTGGIMSLFRESWEELKTSFKNTLKGPPE